MVYTQNVSKKIILGFALVGIFITGILVLNPFKQKSSLLSPLTGLSKEEKKVIPSETLKAYEDPAGFTFSYPDNLSIVKNDPENDSTYADIQLVSKGVNGNLSIKISDSKFKNLDEWLNLNKGATVPKEVSLGSLKGMEVKLGDRVLLGSLDKGVFFDIEIPLIEEDFWTKVYKQVLANFSFVQPDNAQSVDAPQNDVSFEGEEVVE